jgi:hypothetical protein
MLMAGEVEEVVVYPGAKAALILLRPDAVYKVSQSQEILKKFFPFANDCT